MLETRCNQCGAVNVMGSRFCESCGSPLGEQKESRPASPPPPPAPPPPSQWKPASGSPTGFQHPPQIQSQPQSQSSKAVVSLIFGIAGLFMCGPFLSIPGIILGKSEMNAIREGRTPATNEGLAKAGFYVSLIVTIFWIGFFLLAILFGFLPVLLALLKSS